MESRVAPAVLVWALLTAAAMGQEEIGAKVYREVQGCVVALENLEGSGTGIFLDNTGLILTNAHVVASPLPFRCKAEVRHGREIETVTFKKVKVLGVHPKKDLALVRIDPSEHQGTLQTAKLAKRKAVPGQWVCAIGNPAGGGGVQLNKTITTGEISGVGRIIDGVAYYQISAPINAGNSGGPLCNRASEVIGLVTLKFTDVENVGFAIPLDDFKPAEFIPFAQRKGDPAEVRELTGKAEEFFDRALAIRKQRGADDPEVHFCNFIAAKLFHMALMNDPGNAGLYYNIGMLLNQLGENEIASAYLLQAIQLKPWDVDYYSQLGLAMVMQKKLDEALAAWEEGIARFPGQDAKIWEHLIIFYRNERSDLHKSGYAAAMVLHLNDPDTRISMARELFDDARNLLDDEGKKKLGAAVAGIADDIRSRQRAAEEIRRAKKPYATDAFAKYMENFGTLASEEEPVSVVRVEPGPSSSDTSPDSPEEPKLDLTIPEGSIDLLRDVDPKQDAVSGSWKFEGKALVTPFLPHARLQLPTTPPEEYDLTLIVERKSNRKEFVIGFVRGGAQSAFFLDIDGNASSLDPSGRGGHRGALLNSNQPATVFCMIRREGLLVMVDGQRVFFERTDARFPQVPETWKVPDETKLFIGSHITKYYVHKLMLTPYQRRQ